MYFTTTLENEKILRSAHRVYLCV